MIKSTRSFDILKIALMISSHLFCIRQNRNDNGIKVGLNIITALESNRFLRIALCFRVWYLERRASSLIGYRNKWDRRFSHEYVADRPCPYNNKLLGISICSVMNKSRPARVMLAVVSLAHMGAYAVSGNSSYFCMLLWTQRRQSEVMWWSRNCDVVKMHLSRTYKGYNPLV